MSGFSFGTPTTSTATVAPFGTPQASAPSQFSFGNTSLGTAPLGTVTPLGATNTMFSATPATTAPPSFQLSTQPLSTTNLMPANPVTTQQQSSFNFGLSSTAPSSLPTLNTLNTSSAPQQQPQQPQQQSLFGGITAATPQQQPSTLFGGITAPQPSVTLQQTAQITQPPTTGQFTGLGGIDMSTTHQKVVEKGKVEVAKETNIPTPVVQAVEDFKTYVKNQKTSSSEIARSSDRKLKTVTDEIQRMNCLLNESSNNIDHNRASIRHLRNETSKVIENADMAQRTHETPQGLQFENVMPQIYFKELIQKYETDLLSLKQQVELTETHLQSLANPQNFTAQDLKKGLHQLYDSFIALAGRLQEAHTKVETQKSKYLELRKHLLRDSTNVFELNDSTVGGKNTKIQYGPNAFSQDTSQYGFVNMSLQRVNQQQQQQQQPQSFPQSSFFGQPASNFGFGQK